MAIIVETQAGIHEQESLVRLGHQANRSNPPVRRPGKRFRKAVDDSDGHGDI
jgi:hypothetical protein